MGLSKNSGTPKWMVKIMENPIKMDDLGGKPLFSETSVSIRTNYVVKINSLAESIIISDVLYCVMMYFLYIPKESWDLKSLVGTGDPRTLRKNRVIH